MEKIEMTFGYLPISTSVEERLEQLGYDKESLEDAIKEHKKSSDSNMPALYVGTYAKYNMGSIRGLWIDLSTFDTYDDFIDFCYAIHADEDDPELMFQDYECFPREWYDECPNRDSFDNILRYSELCEQYQKDAVDAFVGWGCEDLENFEDCYCGEYNSEKDYAIEVINECYDIEKMMGNLSNYFDYDAFARDLFMCDNYFDNGYVFRHY